MFSTAFAALFGTAHNYGQTRYPNGWCQLQRSGNVRPRQGEAEAQRRRNQQARNLANQRTVAGPPPHEAGPRPGFPETTVDIANLQTSRLPRL